MLKTLVLTIHLHTYILFYYSGYKVEILCITNTVFLPTPITVEVIPALPILKLTSTLPRAPNAVGFDHDNIQTLFTSANLYHGHRLIFILILFLLSKCKKTSKFLFILLLNNFSIQYKIYTIHTYNGETFTLMHKYTHTNIHKYTHACMLGHRTHAYICTHVCVHTHTCTHACIYTHMHIHTCLMGCQCTPKGCQCTAEVLS